MLLFWKIRYLDTGDKEFKDRDLYLDTDSLDPTTKASVELCYELASPGNAGSMLKYRHLFQPNSECDAGLDERVQECGGLHTVSVHDYFEDEQGKALAAEQMALTLTGDPNAVMVPSGAKQHDIDYMLAEKRPIEFDTIALCQEQLAVLGYFARDVRELEGSALCREGPGKLQKRVGEPYQVQTAVTDEQITSFVTIFRRLYMQGEPGNFLRAVGVFGKAAQGHPLAGWVNGVASEYELELAKPPAYGPIGGQGELDFSQKRLIDVFLYARYAHQPDDRRTRQFRKCLGAVKGDEELLKWLFLTSIWQFALRMANAGRVIAWFYERYCQHHGVQGEVVASMAEDSPGIGGLETEQQRRQRILEQKARELAEELWERAGRPPAGPAANLEEARDILGRSVE